MSFQACNWASEQRVGDPVLKLLLLTLANYAGPNGEASWYSQAKMSHDTEIPERSLRRYLQKLVEMELISIEPRQNPDGTKTTSLIAVLMHPPANLAAGHHRPNQGVTTGQNEGSPPANMVAGQESPKNNQEQPVSELPLGAPAPSGDLEKQFFDRAVQIITRSPKEARSAAASLRKACGNDIAKARSALELSAGKSDPAHWLRGHIAWLKKKSNEPTDSTVLMSGADDRHVLM